MGKRGFVLDATQILLLLVVGHAAEKYCFIVIAKLVQPFLASVVTRTAVEQILCLSRSVNQKQILDGYMVILAGI